MRTPGADDQPAGDGGEPASAIAGLEQEPVERAKVSFGVVIDVRFESKTAQKPCPRLVRIPPGCGHRHRVLMPSHFFLVRAGNGIVASEHLI
jgi:hypothetical protein